MASRRNPQPSTSKSWQKQVVCRFFANGMCRQAENCPYSHDLSLSNKGTLPCKYFATGTCAYGDKCRFSHGDPKAPKTRAAPKQLSQAMNKLSLNPEASPWTNLKVRPDLESCPTAIIAFASHVYENGGKLSSLKTKLSELVRNAVRRQITFVLQNIGLIHPRKKKNSLLITNPKC